MSVVIGCLNSKYIHASLAPWCLLSGVRAFPRDLTKLTGESNSEVFVVEGTVNGETEDYVRRIKEKNPEVVGLCSYIWNIDKTLAVCESLKKQINCKIILGGPEVAYRAGEVLENYPFVDFVLSGEGEEAFPLFLEALCNKGDFSTVAGLTYRADGNIISVPEKNFSGTPSDPYCNEFFEKLKGRISYIETSRGCPYRCAFCLSGRVSPLRFFDLEKVKKRIISLANSGTKTVKFVDRTFNANPKRANEIISFIIDNYGTEIPENVAFHFEIAGDILTEETFRLLEMAPKGLFQLEIGMQSFNEETLKYINRKTDSQKLINNINRLVAMGNMHIHIDLIAGLSFEDLSSFERSFNTGYSLKSDMLQMGFLKLLHGAEMRENKEKYPCTFCENPPYEVTSTPWLSENEIFCLKNTEDALERMYNSGRFLFTLDYLLGECGFMPFRLFYDFGNSLNGENMSLSDYAVAVFEYFKDKCNSEILRETIICDLLSCSSALQIPEIFKRPDPKYKQYKKYFCSEKNTAKKVAVLYATRRIFVADHKSKKDFKGRYAGRFYNISDFELNI